MKTSETVPSIIGALINVERTLSATIEVENNTEIQTNNFLNNFTLPFS